MGWFQRWLRAQPPLVDADTARANKSYKVWAQYRDCTPFLLTLTPVRGDDVSVCAACPDDEPTPKGAAEPAPDDRYTAMRELLKAAQHAQQKQKEANAIRDVTDDSQILVDVPAQVFVLVQTESGFPQMRPDEHCKTTILGIYRDAERAERARTNLRDLMRARQKGSEHLYYHNIGMMDLL